MKTTESIKQFVIEVLSEALPTPKSPKRPFSMGSDGVSIKDGNGKTYQGSKSRIYTAMVKFGSSNAERAHILSRTIPASSALISYLKGQNVIKADQPTPRPGKPKVDSWEAYREKQRRAHRTAEKKFQAAVAKFAKNWRGFMLDMPDVLPEDAAPDVAESFFFDYPEWKEWAAAMSDYNYPMSKTTMKEIIADRVYDEMLKGAKDT